MFLPNAEEIGRAKIAICRKRGLDARFPLVEHPTGTVPAARGHRVFALCLEMMEECALVIANMTPFRGVSMDVGTAIEMGYMYGRGRPVFAYTNVVEDYDARVAIRETELRLLELLKRGQPPWDWERLRGQYQALLDTEPARFAQGGMRGRRRKQVRRSENGGGSEGSLAVESFGFADNLMCEGLVWKSGGSVVRTAVPESRRLTDLDAFVLCVDQAVGVLGLGSASAAG